MLHQPSLTLALGALCACIAPAFAGDVRITATGTVTAVTGGAPPAPFHQAAVGDPFEGVFEVIDLPNVVASGFWQYPVDLLQGHVRIGANQVILETLGSGQLNLQDSPNVDAITLGAPLDVGFLGGITLGVIDLNGQVLQSPNVQPLVGTTYVPSFPGSGTLTSSAAAGQITLTITRLVFAAGTCPRIGTNDCNAANNSLNREGTMAACGTTSVAANDVELFAYDLPDGSFGFFLASRTPGNAPNPGGSVGTLCLGGAIGRFVGPGQIKNSGTTGRFSLGIDLTAIPAPTGPVAVAPGDVWHFTAWYRDVQGGAAVSNFADRLTIAFL